MSQFNGLIPLAILIIGTALFLISLICSFVKKSKWLKYMSLALLANSLAGLVFIYQVSQFDDLSRYSINNIGLAVLGMFVLSVLFYKAYEMRRSNGP